MQIRAFYRVACVAFLGAFLWSLPAEAQDKVQTRKNKKGEVCEWVYEKEGAVYKREYDRNGDDKPDLRILEDHGRLLRKEYDNNFDGKFEKVEKPLARGSSGRIKTINSENDIR